MARNLPVLQRHLIHVSVVVAGTSHTIQNGRGGWHIGVQFERVCQFSCGDIHHTHPRIAASKHHIVLPHGSCSVDVIARLKLSRPFARLGLEGVHASVVTAHQQLVAHQIGRTGLSFIRSVQCRHKPIDATDVERRVHRDERSLHRRFQVILKAGIAIHRITPQFSFSAQHIDHRIEHDG